MNVYLIRNRINDTYYDNYGKFKPMCKTSRIYSTAGNARQSLAYIVQETGVMSYEIVVGEINIVDKLDDSIVIDKAKEKYDRRNTQRAD